jgi:hypothetical protein
MNTITIPTTSVDLPSAPTPIRKVRRTRSDWSALVDVCQASGQTQKSFCEAQGLSYRQFTQWKSRLKLKPATESDDSPRFTPVRLTSTPLPTPVTTHAIQVSLPSGIQVSLSSEADTAQTSSLIQQLLLVPC